MNDTVNTEINDDDGFDESQIPDSVRKEIEKAARQGYIPQERYDQSVGKLKGRLTALEQGAQKPEAKPEKTYSRSQLRTLVDEGTITEDQMDAQIERQMKAEATKSALSAVESQTERSKSAAIVDEYKELLDGLDDDGSDNRERAKEAFLSIVDIQGSPKGAAEIARYEVLALQQAFGPLKSLKKKGRELSNSHRETHQEVGGDYEAGSKDPETKGLSKRVMDYYGPQVDKGMTTWKDVKDELKHVTNPGVRERLGLKPLK